MTELYANPYNIHAQGFCFNSHEGFEEMAGACTDAFGRPVEEFEIQFIDGEAIDAALFQAWGVCQSDIEAFLDAVETLDEDEKLALIALGECGYLIKDNPPIEDVELYRCDGLAELARQFVDEGLYGEIPESLAHYIDFGAIARDLGIEYSEMRIGGQTYIYRCP